jgi:hypothetical protein
MAAKEKTRISGVMRAVCLEPGRDPQCGNERLAIHNPSAAIP